MTRKFLRTLAPGTPEFVIAHAAWRRSRGRNPSMSYAGVRNPILALQCAKNGGMWDKPVNMNVPKQKLGRLHALMGPNPLETTVEFGNFLSDYIKQDQLVPAGFVLACELALTDLSKGIDGFTKKPIKSRLVGYPPMIFTLIRAEIPSIAEVIFPPEFALGVKTFAAKIQESIDVKTMEAKKAAVATRVLPSDDELFAVFKAARKIADLSYEFFSTYVGNSEWLDDRRSEGVNPFYCQTTGGLFLEQYYGIPGSIWTPWGKWDCWGSGSSSDAAMKAFLGRIEAVEVIPVRHDSQGTHGPVFAIKSIDGIILPEPVRREKAAYLEYEEANKQWNEMLQRFQGELVAA